MLEKGNCHRCYNCWKELCCKVNKRNINLVCLHKNIWFLFFFQMRSKRTTWKVIDFTVGQIEYRETWHCWDFGSVLRGFANTFLFFQRSPCWQSLQSTGTRKTQGKRRSCDSTKAHSILAKPRLISLNVCTFRFINCQKIEAAQLEV